MPLAYSDLSACADFVTTQTTLEPDDLETLLEVSAGRDANDEPVYRPYMVASLLLARMSHDDLLLKAKDGVTFGDPKATIAGWRVMQGALDRALGLTVPLGFAATETSGTASPSAGSVPMVVTF